MRICFPAVWAVLGALALTPARGFAVARVLAANGDARTRLADEAGRACTGPSTTWRHAGLIAPTGTAPSDRGPTRTLYEATMAGCARLDAWLGYAGRPRPRDAQRHAPEARDPARARDLPARRLLDAQRAALVPVLAQPRLGRSRPPGGSKR